MEIEEGGNGEAWRWYGARLMGMDSVLLQSTLTLDEIRSGKLPEFVRYRCLTSVSVKPTASGVDVNFGRSIVDGEQECDGVLRKDAIIRICLPNPKLIPNVCEYWGKKAIHVAKESDLKIIK